MKSASLEEKVCNSKKTPKIKKPQISLVLHERTIKTMDEILKQFENISNGKYPNSRNELVQAAMEDFIEASSSVLLEDYNIDVKELTKAVEV